MRGTDLARAYAEELVGPLLDRELPGVPIALARLGSGSDVLGYDDSTSRDHDWGARLTVLVPESEVDRADAALEAGLPASFRGHPLRFPVSWDRRDHQRAEVVSPLGFARFRTGLDLSREPSTLEWLSLTGQAALEIAGGPVFRDDSGELTDIRARLSGYPDDVRRFAIAAGWQAIGRELPFVGRTAQRGDEAGTRVIAARLVRQAMLVGFLLEGRWAPYAKWLGTGFARLPHVGRLAAPLRRALSSNQARDRESALETALDGLARYQEEVGLPTLLPVTERFYDRPFAGLRVVGEQGGIPELTQASIADPVLRSHPLVGVPEQWTDDYHLLMDGERRQVMTRALYPGLGA